MFFGSTVTGTSVVVPTTDYELDYVGDDTQHTAVGAYSVRVAPAEFSENLDITDTLASRPIFTNAYRITKADIKNAELKLVENVPAGTAKGSWELTKLLEHFDVTLNGISLNSGALEGVTVTVTATDTNAGTVASIKLDATAAKNFSGENTSGSFTYAVIPLKPAYVTDWTAEYTGSAIVPPIGSLKEANWYVDGLPEKPADGDLTSANFNIEGSSSAVNVGTYTARIVGRGNYAGQSATVEYKIIQKDFTTLYPQGSTYKYEVSTITPDLPYYKGQRIEGVTLTVTSTNATTGVKTEVKKFTTDEVAVYVDTISDGYLTKVIAKGIGNYKGTSSEITLPAPGVVTKVADLANAQVTANIPAGMPTAVYQNVASTSVGLKKYIKVVLNNTELDPNRYTLAYVGSVPTTFAIGQKLNLKITPVTGSGTEFDGITGEKTIDNAVIVARDITDITKTAADPSGNVSSINPRIYNGSEQKPKIEINSYDGLNVKDGKIVEGTDYQLSYTNNVDAGLATVTITGINNYTGSASKTFVINKRPLGSEIVKATAASAAADSFWWTEPDASLRQFSIGATPDLSSQIVIGVGSSSQKYSIGTADYTLKLLGPATLTSTKPILEQKVSYALYINKDSRNYVPNYPVGQKYFTLTYDIVPRTVTDADVTIQKNEFAAGDVLNKDALGNVKVVVDGKTQTDFNYAIEQVETVNATGVKTIKVEASHNAWTGYESGVGGVIISDSEGTKTYTYNLVIEFKSDNDYYRGVIRKSLAVGASAKFDINDVNVVKFSDAQLVYDPRSKADLDPVHRTITTNYVGPLNGIPAVTATTTKFGTYWNIFVYDANDKLLTAENALDNAGTYKVVVAATENYGGAEGTTYEFTVVPKTLTEADFKGEAARIILNNVSFNGEGTAQPTIESLEYDASHKLTNVSDWEAVEWDKTWDLSKGYGVADMALKANSNFAYEGTFEKRFDWEKGNLRSNVFDGSSQPYYTIDPVTYTGSAQAPAVKAVDGAGVDATWITSISYTGDVTNAYSNNAAARITVTVPVTAEKYEANTVELVVPFTINPTSIEDATIEPISDKVYTGDPIRPQLSIKNAAGAQMTEGTDFSVAYTDNIEIGEATAVITGIQNYTGTATTKFQIVMSAYEKALEEAVAAVQAATPGTAEADKAAAALEKAISDAKIAGVKKDITDVAEKALTDARVAKAEALANAAKTNPTTESVKAAEDAIKEAQAAGATSDDLKKASETATAAKDANIANLVKAAETAAKNAQANATPANIKAAEDAIKAATDAGATAAQVKTASDAVTAAKGGSDRTQDQTAALLTSFTSASNAVPALNKVKDTDLEKVNTALAAYEKLSPAQKATADVKKSKEALDAAKKKIMNPTITFKNKKVKAKGKNKLTVGKKLKLKAKSNTGRKCTYESSKPSVASVDKNGKIKALKKGTCKITVKCRNTTKVIKVKVK